MFAYLLRRALTLLPILLLMSIIVFGLIRLVPGDPIDVMYGSEGMDEIRRAALSQELGLDQPIVVQYGRWLLRAVQGDLGNSYRANMSVFTLIMRRLPATLLLSFASLVLSILIALPLGLLAAVKRNSGADMGAMVFAILGISLPNFWLGILLVLVFAVWLRWLPSIGYVSPLDDFFGFLRHLILPSIALGWALAGTTTRLARSSLLEELGKDYVRTAPGLTCEGLLHKLREALSAQPGVTIEIETLRQRCYTGAVLEALDFLPPWRSAVDDPWPTRLLGALAVAGLPAETFAAPSGTNASETAGRRGIPSFIFGPGTLAQAHIPDEWVAVDDLRHAQRGLEAIASTVARASSPGSD